MDHSSGPVQQQTQTSRQGDPNFNAYVTDANGNSFRVPYRMIKKVTFVNVSKSEMIDLPHAARLQYRLMLLEPVLKASVDFTKSKISVIYNPDTADNHKEKISLEELRAVLKKEGISTTEEQMTIEDYDYYNKFYNYAFIPPSIRERAPYGYTLEQWQKEKPEWEAKIKQGEIDKRAKFKAFQNEYLESNPEMAAKIDPAFKAKEERKPSLKEKLFGKKKGGSEKGFWFHGI